MTYANTDLNLLRVFDAIYSQGTLTRAADLLFITQPAVSHALGRLRGIYKDQLFVRSASGMKPTPFSHEIARDIRDALHRVRVTMSKSEGFRPENSARHFRFGMVDMIETFVMPRLVNHIQREAPGITVEIFQSSRRDLQRGLLGLDVDFVIDTSMPQHPQIDRALYYKDEFAAAVRPGHPLIGTPLTLERYLDYGHVHVSSKRKSYSHVDSALSELGVQRRIVLQTPYYLDAPHIVAPTDLILTTSGCLAKRFGLRVLDLPFKIAPMTVWVYWLASAGNDPAVAWMRHKVLHELYPNLNDVEKASVKAADKRRARSSRLVAETNGTAVA